MSDLRGVIVCALDGLIDPLRHDKDQQGVVEEEAEVALVDERVALRDGAAITDHSPDSAEPRQRGTSRHAALHSFSCALTRPVHLVRTPKIGGMMEMRMSSKMGEMSASDLLTRCTSLLFCKDTKCTQHSRQGSQQHPG